MSLTLWKAGTMRLNNLMSTQAANRQDRLGHARFDFYITIFISIIKLRNQDSFKDEHASLTLLKQLF